MNSRALNKTNRSKNGRQSEQGSVHPTTIMLIVMIVLFIITGSLAIWAYVNYDKAKTNLDIKINEAVADAKREQSEADDKKFNEKEKEPNRQFVGPTDYGRVTFNYPKTWSAYEQNSAEKGGNYQAFLHPMVVPPINEATRLALRVTVQNVDYDQVLKTQEGLLKAGKITSAPVSANGNTGTRFDGDFKKDLRGAMVVYKIRDKTLTIATDAPQFFPDFENLIKTINFNQ